MTAAGGSRLFDWFALSRRSRVGPQNAAAWTPNLRGDRLSVLLCSGAIAIGIIALTGYVLANASIASLSANGKPVSVVTALALILLGTGLLALRSPAPAGLLTARRAALGVIVLAAADLMSAAFSPNVEEWKVWAARGDVPVHAYPITALLLIASASALVFVTTRKDFAGHLIASAVLSICGVFSFGYFLQVPSFLDPSRRIAPVAPTTLGIVLISAGVLLARPRGWVVPLLARTPAGLRSRLLLAAAIVVPFTALALRALIVDAPWYTDEVGLTVIVAVNVFFSATIVLGLEVILHKRVSDRARLVAIVESSDDAIIGTSIAGLIESWNGGAEQLYGYTAAEAIGRSVTMLAPPERQDESPRVFERIGRGERADAFETVRVTKDGRSIDVWLSVSPVRDDADNVVGVSTIARDITQRKQEQEALRSSEERLRLAQRAAGIGHFSWDIQANIITPSDELLALYGLPPASFSGTYESWRALIFPGDLAAVDAEMKKALASGEFFCDCRVVWPDESIHWLHSRAKVFFSDVGKPLRTVGVSMDITARVATEQALRDSEVRYRQLFAANPHPMWVFDLETLAFLEVNDAAVARYGYRRDEFQAMTIADIRSSEEVPRLQVHLSAVGNIDFDDAGTWKHRTKDGAIIDVEVMSHILDYDGRRAELVLALDITERLRAEEALRDSEEALAEAQQIAHIGSWILYPESGEGRGSAEAHRIFAIDPAPVIPLQLILDRIHEDDRARVGAAITASFHSGTLDEEARFVTPRGTRMLRVSARKRETNEPRPSMIGTIQDITEMKAAEITLRQHAEILERHTADLERFNRLAVGRELRMIELKQQINDLCAQLGQPAPYVLPEERALAKET